MFFPSGTPSFARWLVAQKADGPVLGFGTRRSRRKVSSALFMATASVTTQPMASLRLFSTFGPLSKERLSHIDPKTGRASMVDVSSKTSTSRSATASGRVVIPASVHRLLSGQDAASTPEERKALSKGDVFTVAQLAGIQAAKKTSDLIPLCHPLALSHVSVTVALSPSPTAATGNELSAVEVEATVRCEGKTGVEMEALTAVNVACLTVFDMLKAVCGRAMVIEGVKVVQKQGGKSGTWEA